MINLFFLLLYNVIRHAFCRSVNMGRWHVKWMQRISPLCTLKTFDKSQLRIERNCEFAAYCDFEAHGKGVLEIGEKTYFNRYCMISAHESVKIGKECMFGPGVKIFDNNHQYTAENGVSSKLNTAPISIGDHCWIASDVIILKGTTIGKNCVIGAGCVVKGNIPNGSIVKRELISQCVSKIEK